ncbi:MAG: sensor domain-containing diguanylate cyclase [Chloroflexota bacterium]
MTLTESEDHYQTLFEYAPISMWEEDFSGIKCRFDELRAQGVHSLEEYLADHAGFVEECLRLISVTQVNQKTLSLFKAASQEELIAHLTIVFGDEMRSHFEQELLTLWQGGLTWSGEGVNYTLQGEPLDIRMSLQILSEAEQTWKRVLVTLEDITERKTAERRFEHLFEACPISLWEEDYSGIKDFFNHLRTRGVTNIGAYLAENPQAVTDCMGRIKVINVNQKTLELFKANSKDELLSNLNRVFRDEMGRHFTAELIDMWNGQWIYEREGVNYALTGEPIDVQLQVRIMPGYEETFKWVLVSLQDITARKKAEAYLRYLGTHDVLTGLYNRAYLEETLRELERNRQDPIGFLVCDLNGLKQINDTLGHQAGDELIRRAAEVIRASCDENQTAARIGGDEFIVIMPATTEKQARKMIAHLQSLVELNNKFYHHAPPLSLSIGAAVSRENIPLEKVISQADDEMYKAKGQYYRRRREDREMSENDTP